MTSPKTKRKLLQFAKSFLRKFTGGFLEVFARIFAQVFGECKISNGSFRAEVVAQNRNQEGVRGRIESISVRLVVGIRAMNCAIEPSKFARKRVECIHVEVVLMYSLQHARGELLLIAIVCISPTDLETHGSSKPAC